jgi:hypothetical protein
MARFNISVVREYSEAPEIQGDRDQLLQVFMNLIGNATDAMRPQGKGRLTLRVAPASGSVEASVIDSGPGIPADLLQHIFDPFFTTKEPGEGTGLGLSISRRIIADHRGTLRAENRPEVGACFTVALPVDGSRAVSEPLPTPGRVLVLHQDASTAAALAEAVSVLGYLADTRGADLRHIDVSPDTVAIIVDEAIADDRLQELRLGAPQARLIGVTKARVTSSRWDATIPISYRLGDVESALGGANSP